MRIMKRILLVLFTVLGGSMIYAGEDDSKTSIMMFSEVPASPSVLSAGGIASLETSSAWSSFNNISAVTFSPKAFSAAVSWQRWSPASEIASSHINAGVSYNHNGRWGLTAGFKHVSEAEYTEYDAYGRKNGTYTPSDLEAVAGVSYKLTNYLSAGVGIKYMKSSLASDYSLSATAFDAMLEAVLGDFQVIAGISSVGGAVDGWDLPTKILVSGSYSHSMSQKHKLRLGTQVNYYLSGGAAASLGTAYCYNDLLSLRLGYNQSFNGILPSFASLGAGICLYGFHLDASFVLTGFPSNSLSVSINREF